MDSIGGYRLVRLLGSGSRADVWLGHGGTTDSGTETVAVKVYRAGAAQTDIDTEIEALARSSHRHLLRLEDLATAPDGLPSLILQRLSPMSLGHLLSAGPLPPGEAVTVLAPLALAVAALHRVGVTHGGIRPSAVLFDNEGAPVLARFSSAGVVADLPLTDTPGLHPAQLAAASGVAADLAQLAGLCRAVLGGAAELLGEWASYSASLDPQAWTQELADRLFRLAEPAPVRLDRRRPPERSSLVPLRVGGEGPRQPELLAPESDGEVASPARSGPWHDAFALLHLPDALLAPAGRWKAVLEAGPVATLRPALRRALRSVRRPVWVIAGVVALAVVAAVAMLPGGASEAEQAGVPAGSAAAEPTQGPTPPVSGAATVHPAILGDDPAAAAVALLAARAECMRAASILCLDGVDQPGSAAIEADAYRIRMAQEGGVENPEPALTGIEPTVVDRLGDSALLSLDRAGTPVASLLLIRAEPGWRIRDLVFADESR